MNTHFKISLQMYGAFFKQQHLLEVMYWINLNKEYYGNENLLLLPRMSKAHYLSVFRLSMAEGKENRFEGVIS